MIVWCVDNDPRILEGMRTLLEGWGCEVVTLASINEEGYPRVCVISKIKTEGIRTIWMATGTHSAKTGHFRQNPKASVCYFLGGDSVTLLGEVEIVRDAAVKRELWQDWYIYFGPVPHW